MNQPIQTSAPEIAAIREKLFINGQWVKAVSGRTLPVYNPATGDVIANVQDAGPADIEAAVRSARDAFESPAWRDMLPAQRERLLLNLADLMEKHGEELARLETLNNGKLLMFSRMLEVGANAQWVRYMAGWATKIEGSTLDISFPLPPGAKYSAMTRREPVGVVGAIIPWNFPLLMAMWKIAPALACGCTVVLKPAEETPLTALRIAELIVEAGFPPGVVNVVTGYGETAGDAFEANPEFRTVLNWNFRHNFHDVERRLCCEEVEVHRRADCVCAQAGRGGYAGRGGLQEDGYLGCHLLQLAQEVRRAGAV